MRYIPLLFGRFLVKAGWVSEMQVEQAATLQRELTPSLGLVAVLEDRLSVEALRGLLAHQRRLGLCFHEAALQLGLLDEAQLAGLEAQRRVAAIQLGEALIVRGDLTDIDLQEALSAFIHYKASNELVPRRAPATEERDPV